MNYSALRAELLDDPLAWGYATLSNGAAAARLNALDTGRAAARTRVENTEVFNAIVNADWPAAGSVSESKLLALLAMPYVDASNANTRAIIGAIFGANTATRANLLALATRPVSRAEELGLGAVSAGDVALARGGVW